MLLIYSQEDVWPNRLSANLANSPMLSVSPLLFGSIPILAKAESRALSVIIGRLADFNAFLNVFLLWLNAALTTLKKNSSSNTSTLLFSRIRKDTTADSTFGI